MIGEVGLAAAWPFWIAMEPDGSALPTSPGFDNGSQLGGQALLDLRVLSGDVCFLAGVVGHVVQPVTGHLGILQAKLRVLRAS